MRFADITVAKDDWAVVSYNRYDDCRDITKVETISAQVEIYFQNFRKNIFRKLTKIPLSISKNNEKDVLR